MLKNTFCHIPGCSAAVEKNLWAAGITSWEELLAAKPPRLSRQKAALYTAHIEASMQHLANNHANYFVEQLPSHQHWRCFPEFRHSIAYLDIETTGLNYRDAITTIALYDGHSIFHYVQGDNLDAFKRDIKRYALLVTYNGKCFDVPFIERYFGIQMQQAHIDLRYVLRSLGYKGGLKGCERQLGIDRQELDGVDGFFAVLLWDDYRKTKSIKSLETLLAYNIQDVVNLEQLLIIAYNQKLADTPFRQRLALPKPTAPVLPFAADTDTIRRIQKQKAYAWSYGWR
ncbi:MAG: ribonuclease H-like domain-containing protein [Acidobacteria bacterium]|nr:ribonuclease H-like domain-containing protein [Acidobacteriota bacterium]